jgi:hypothetical protein
MPAARALIALVALYVLALPAAGQMQPLDQITVEIGFDSGPVTNASDQREVIYSTVVREPGVAWLRLKFDEATLGAAPAGGESTILRVTSLLDKAVQTMTAEHLRQWRDSTAYFNGDGVRVELLADPGAAVSRLVMTGALAGVHPSPPESICGPVDDRMLSDDPRTGRLIPIGCTAWLIDDPNHCFLTAGHCTGAADVVEFNVPLSTSGGSLQHPGPEDQYAVDPVSMQTNGGQGVGNDWGYFGCFPNTQTDLTAYEAQGDFFVLEFPPPVSGQTIRITGYGTTSSPVPPQWNQAQKTHTGPFVTSSGTTVQYQTDTTGGNSGSPVINDDTGEAIGIHTHGGCDSGGGQNSGTGVNIAALQTALANPRGVCIPTAQLDFAYPDGLPTLFAPSGQTIRVDVVGVDGATHQTGSGVLHYDTGSGFVSAPMTAVDGNSYDAEFPAIECGVNVRYYFSAETTDGDEGTDPITAPGNSFSSLSAFDVEVAFSDDFETHTGWVVENVSLEDGPWERVTPNTICNRGNPLADADGSGMCYVTDNDPSNCDNDVDGGPTRLISPFFDVSGMTDPQIAYSRWFTNDDGDADRMTVDLSANGGATWTNVETIGNTIGWNTMIVRIADYVDLTSSVRIRFSVIDNPNNSVTEGGVDGVQLLSLDCTGISADVDDDGDVDFQDLLLVLAEWGDCPDPPAECPGDIDGDGDVDFEDLLLLLSMWDP